MADIQHLQKTIAHPALLPGEPDLVTAADIFVPARPLTEPPAALFCLPGGALDRGYYDLQLEGGDYSFSFARQLAAQGFIVVTMDHLGIGASSKPRDGFTLTPDVLIAANAAAADQIIAQLRSGQTGADLPALPELRAVGVGHSMGAMLTAMQQARYRNYAAVALLGFSTNGLIDFLPEPVRPYVDDAAGARAHIERLARAQGGDPYRKLELMAGNAREVYGGGADRRAVAALARARTNLIAVPALFSMIPGSTAPDCAQIDVPVFLAIGDRDICGPTHKVPASFPASAEVSLLILRDTGHSHFLFQSSALLYARLAAWLRVVLELH